MKKLKLEDFFDDPTPPKETREFLNEQFEMYKARGVKPEAIVEEPAHTQYVKWLKKHQ